MHGSVKKNRTETHFGRLMQTRRFSSIIDFYTFALWFSFLGYTFPGKITLISVQLVQVTRSRCIFKSKFLNNLNWILEICLNFLHRMHLIFQTSSSISKLRNIFFQIESVESRLISKVAHRQKSMNSFTLSLSLSVSSSIVICATFTHRYRRSTVYSWRNWMPLIFYLLCASTE